MDFDTSRQPHEDSPREQLKQRGAHQLLNLWNFMPLGGRRTFSDTICAYSIRPLSRLCDTCRPSGPRVAHRPTTCNSAASSQIALSPPSRERTSDGVSYSPSPSPYRASARPSFNASRGAMRRSRGGSWGVLGQEEKKAPEEETLRRFLLFFPQSQNRVFNQ